MASARPRRKTNTAGGLFTFCQRNQRRASGIVWGTEGPAAVAHYTRTTLATWPTNFGTVNNTRGATPWGNYTKFCSPTIVNGKVYVATTSSNLVVYGLLSSAPAFRITALTLQGNDVALTWATIGGTTNIVQATAAQPGGNYSNNFCQHQSTDGNSR